MDILTFDHVSYTYPDDRGPVIRDLSFAIPDGSFICLLGSSGSGRSTIFRLTNGLLTPDSGTIRVAGVPVRTGKSFCGSMQKADLLYPWQTIGENLTLPLRKDTTASDVERGHAVSAALDSVGLGGYRDRKPEELDAVGRKKAAFARALLAGGSLLLLDDPLAGLGPEERAEMEDFLAAQWKATGKTMLLATDDIREAMLLAEDIYLLSGTPADTLEKHTVPLPYPRSRDMLGQPDLLALRETLLKNMAF
ncbi:ATP-binding cassette domain-containing protein [Clostridium vitabionis]|uniref:ATP-binding cassette domain-containing protein n=1 Tax=Clostridium vitabionis TaxID=2784388 RepID=UPI001889FB37|nr:ATP-binding cassette domain-containing protein [Clostridium vitabionis]